MANEKLGIYDVTFVCGHTREVAKHIAIWYVKEKRGFCFRCFKFVEVESSSLNKNGKSV